MASLADRLCDLVDRPVMVLDPALHPLATTRWPTDVSPGDKWLTDVHHDHWWRGRMAGDDRPVLTPIAVGAHLGGYLAVLDRAQPLDLIDARAIEHAATIFALEMLRERTTFDAESRVKGDLLGDLFRGTQLDERDVERLLTDLGYAMNGPWRVAQLHATWRRPVTTGDARWSDEVHAPNARLYPLIQQLCVRTVGTAAAAPWRSGFLLLLPRRRMKPNATSRSPPPCMPARGWPPTASGPAPGSTSPPAPPSTSPPTSPTVSASPMQALQVARTLDIFDRPGDLRAPRRYRGAARQERVPPARRLHPGSPRTGHPLRHRARLPAARHLHGYVAADHNGAKAARRLYIHPNTLAYRMRTIRRLLGGDPCRGDLRLQVELALKLARAVAHEGG